MLEEGIRQETGLDHRKEEAKGWGMGRGISFVSLRGVPLMAPAGLQACEFSSPLCRVSRDLPGVPYTEMCPSSCSWGHGAGHLSLRNPLGHSEGLSVCGQAAQ